MSVESSVVIIKDTCFPQRKISKLLIVFYLLYQVVGLDFGFTSVLKRKYRLIVLRSTRFVSVLSIIVMSVYFACLYDDFWCDVASVKNNVFILVLITTRYKLYYLISDLNGICTLTTKQTKILNSITILFTILTYSIKITLMTVRCLWEKEPNCAKFYSLLYYFVFLGIALNLDVIVVTQFIITYYLKCSVNAIKVLLKKPNRKLDAFERAYMAIADCYDKIRPLYDWMVIIEVGINVPKLMGNIWSAMLSIKDNGKWYSYSTEFVISLHLTTEICVTAIIVELLNSEIDSTTKLLNQEIMREKDEREIEELKRVLRYIRNRPLRHLVLRFIPIDLRLLLTLFSLCTTYFIVALQFFQMF